jgi:hypothetical protein
MRQAADFWKTGKGRHWATPRSDPPRDIQLKQFEPAEPADIVDVILRFMFEDSHSFQLRNDV